MREEDTKLFQMFKLPDVSNTHSFNEFKSANRLSLKNKSWFLIKPSTRKPRIRLFGKQDTLHRQLYRYFIGEPPAGKLVSLTTNGDYNPWHWQGKRVPDLQPVPVENIVPIEVSPNIDDIVTLVKQRQARGGKDPWQGLEEFFEPNELEQAKEIMDAE